MNTDAGDYYLAINGVQNGPLTKEEFFARINRGEARGTDLGWKEGWDKWTPLAEAFPSLFPTAPAGFSSPPVPVSKNGYAGSWNPGNRRITIEDNVLLVPLNQPFPLICAKTGATENLIDKPKRVVLSWHHPAVYIAILVNVIIYVVIAMLARKKSTHLIYFTKEVAARQSKWHLINWGVFFATVVTLIAGINMESGALGFLTFGLVIAIITIYFTKVRGLYCTKIDDSVVRIAGIRRDVMLKIVDASQ